MKLGLIVVVLLSSLANLQEKQKVDQESLVSERKKQIEELQKLQQESVEKARQQVLANPDSAEAHFQLADVL